MIQVRVSVVSCRSSCEFNSSSICCFSCSSSSNNWNFNPAGSGLDKTQRRTLNWDKLWLSNKDYLQGQQTAPQYFSYECPRSKCSNRIISFLLSPREFTRYRLREFWVRVRFRNLLLSCGIKHRSS